jgi:hypothetical protein
MKIFKDLDIYNLSGLKSGLGIIIAQEHSFLLAHLTFIISGVR